MKISIITILGGAVLAGALAFHGSTSSEIAEPKVVAAGPVAAGPMIVEPDDVPGTDSEQDRIVAVTGTVVDVGLASLMIEDDGLAPVHVAVPATAEITRDGKEVELSEVIPGDFARVDAVVDNNGKLSARTVAAKKLR